MCTKDRDAVGARSSSAPTRHSSFTGDSSNPRSLPRRRFERMAGPLGRATVWRRQCSTRAAQSV